MYADNVLFDDYQSKYTEIDFSSVKFLWAYDQYDGPACGLLNYNDEKLWFFWIDDLEKHRVYIIQRPSPEQLAFLTKTHEDFRQYVGHHMDLDENFSWTIHSEESQKIFYDKYLEIDQNTEVDDKLIDELSNCEILGWVKW